MTELLRSTGRSLVRIAMQAGLARAEDAESALMIGARFLAHGFTDHDIDRMIQGHYRERPKETP